ncbi:MAG: hypothetical protein HWD58_08880 [Bacteroidota bacterium]|nr:MAG: hypothetical protein HWD58_08880 [Bacteroidota bacterium]
MASGKRALGCIDLNHLAKEMNWMDTPEIQQAGYAKIQQNLLRTLLPQQFLKQQDTLRMLLCYHLYENKKSSYYGYTEQPDSVTFTHYIGTNSAYWLDRYCSISQLDTLRRILLKPGTTLDAWLAGNTQYTQAHLRELQAVKRFREFDFEGALTHIQSQDQMPVVPDVFVAHIRDYQDGYPEDDAHSYSLFNLLDTLSQLKKFPSWISGLVLIMPVPCIHSVIMAVRMPPGTITGLPVPSIHIIMMPFATIPGMNASFISPKKPPVCLNVWCGNPITQT